MRRCIDILNKTVPKNLPYITIVMVILQTIMLSLGSTTINYQDGYTIIQAIAYHIFNTYVSWTLVFIETGVIHEMITDIHNEIQERIGDENE